MDLRFGIDAHRRYIKQLASVHGWLDPFSAIAIAALSLHQVLRGYRGAVAEVGVHHGKLFFLLYLTTRSDETAVAIDVFSAQHLNIDKSGYGDRTVFENHAKRWSSSFEGLSIIEDSSFNVTPQRLLAAGGAVRLFSIDGSHTEEATINDLQLAEATLAEHGVAIVDDCFNESWPEVSAGIAKYLPAGALVPFVITPGKVWLCRPQMKSSFTSMFLEEFPTRVDKKARVFGNEVHIVGVRPLTIRRFVGATRFGAMLKRLRDAVLATSRSSRIR